MGFLFARVYLTQLMARRRWNVILSRGVFNNDLISKQVHCGFNRPMLLHVYFEQMVRNARVSNGSDKV